MLLEIYSIFFPASLVGRRVEKEPEGVEGSRVKRIRNRGVIQWICERQWCVDTKWIMFSESRAALRALVDFNIPAEMQQLEKKTTRDGHGILIVAVDLSICTSGKLIVETGARNYIAIQMSRHMLAQ